MTPVAGGREDGRLDDTLVRGGRLVRAAVGRVWVDAERSVVTVPRVARVVLLVDLAPVGAWVFLVVGSGTFLRAGIGAVADGWGRAEVEEGGGWPWPNAGAEGRLVLVDCIEGVAATLGAGKRDSGAMS